MSQLKVYKASAGSGKTFRLAIEYMKLALSNETNYRHILAVTFTNKATAEMKSRIIGELYRLANGKKSAYLDVLSGELGWQPMQIQLQAQLVLKRILHDYSRFSISTIDSFFQRVIKAFNRELGINAAYNVELDEMSILEEAADRLIQSVEDNHELLEWLDSFASDKMREGKGWNLKRDIIRLGAEIYNETFKSLNNDLYEKLNNRSFLRDYQKKLGQIINRFESSLKSLGQEGLNVIAGEGLTADDFKGKGRGPVSAFLKMKNVDTGFSNTILAAANDSSAWVTASVKEPHKSKILSVAEHKLMPKLQQAIRLIESDNRNYITAKLVVNQLYTLGILVDLRQFVKEICREKGIILISDSGHLLKDVIADSEAPFVYEKTGSVYSHFMIDEFQDTSGLQWNNFRPLIANSLAEGNLGLVVGDVKQAIYRWRSGDWRLLAGKLGESFPVFGLQNEVLNSNWRSCGNIIRFNNAIFSLAPTVIQQNIDGELAEAHIAENQVGVTVPDVYADCVQEVSNKETAGLGYVYVQFLESKKDQANENEQTILNDLVSEIKKLQDNQVKANEIAILVRDKNRARQMADLFLEQKSLPENQLYNFDILSGESLFINNSEAISLIIAVLTSFLNPDDQVVRAQINYLYYSKIHPKLKQLGKIPDFKPGNDDSDLQAPNSGQLNLLNDLFSATSSREPTFEPDMEQMFEKMETDENDLLQYVTGKSFQERIAGKPILEIIYSICEKFNLFSLIDELAYLQAFVDQISVFERNHASELTSFLDWWKDNGQRFTIPVSENIDAINVLTIHKSKGLEFNYVFIPFFDWSIHPHVAEMAPLLWCKPETEPFNEIDLLPVRYKKDVGKSIFFREYFFEKFNTFIDNLNLMYVAFTRAKSGLYIWASYSDKLSTVGDLLKLSVDHYDQFAENTTTIENFAPLSLCYLADVNRLEIGNLTDWTGAKQQTKTLTDVRISQFEFADFRKFLKIKRVGEDFFTSENKRQSGINQGKIVHETLSRIETMADLPKAVKRMETDGKIPAGNVERTITDLSELLAEPEVKNWFNGTYRVINERNILTGVNGVKRPDRIMIGDNEVIVIDYKSGDTESEKYKYQLRSYVAEMKRCGLKNVTGYLWYTKLNKRVKI
jgi:ATP-dependent exoDNAse (exonuclease V) beta subunit